MVLFGENGFGTRKNRRKVPSVRICDRDVIKLARGGSTDLRSWPGEYRRCTVTRESDLTTAGVLRTVPTGDTFSYHPGRFPSQSESGREFPPRKTDRATAPSESGDTERPDDRARARAAIPRGPGVFRQLVTRHGAVTVDPMAGSPHRSSGQAHDILAAGGDRSVVSPASVDRIPWYMGPKMVGFHLPWSGSRYDVAFRGSSRYADSRLR